MPNQARTHLFYIRCLIFLICSIIIPNAFSVEASCLTSIIKDLTLEVHHLNNFVKVEGLGANESVVLMVKNSSVDGNVLAHRLNVDNMEKTGSTTFYSERTSLHQGFIAKIKLNSLNKNSNVLSPSDKDNWIIHGTAPHGFDQNKQHQFFAFTNSIEVRSRKSGKIINTISHPIFKNLHTLEISPRNPDILLVANSGMDNLLEVNTKTGAVRDIWNPIKNPINGKKPEILPGLEITNSKDIAGYDRILSMDEAKDLFFNKGSVPDGKKWAYVMNYDEIVSPIGIPRWMRSVFPNWSGYSPNKPGVINATFYEKGLAVEIYPDGTVKKIQKNLGRPHGVVPWGDKFIVNDTTGGEVRILDSEMNLIKNIKFSQLPVPDHITSNKEWIQNTYPLNDENLLATVDGRRHKVYVWDIEKKVYSEFDYSEKWEIQSVQGSN